MKKLVVNGFTLVQEKRVGVPRYVIELLKGMDQLDLPFEVEVLLPKETDVEFKNIKKLILRPDRYKKKFKGYGRVWQFIDVPLYVKHQDCVYFEPAFNYTEIGADVCVVYDLQPEHFRGNYKMKKRLAVTDKLQQFLREKTIKGSKRIIAISNYVREDLLKTYPDVGPDKVSIAGCGWQHMEAVTPDETVFEDFPEISKSDMKYFFSLGSRYAHKNIQWIYAAAQQNPENIFVVTGYNDVAAYSEKLVAEAPENVIFTGYLSDERVKFLMQHCRAFIQPSLSEGFGIPPLEALSCGAEIIVSDTTSLPEVFGKTAHYINPRKYDGINMDAILSSPVDAPDEVLKKYSWVNAAKEAVKAIEKLV